LRDLLPGWEIEPVGDVEMPEEIGTTFYENALAKARFAQALDPSAWVFGEDSGLEVAGLDGAPGIRSARYAGESASDEENVSLLLRELEGVDGAGRKARYVSELVALGPDGVAVRGTGTLEGEIARERKGTEGFGYDPVFVPAGETRTVAQLGGRWKREHSHRAAATRVLLERVGEGVWEL
jgi:XTP/dITP diphosphohydrolase